MTITLDKLASVAVFLVVATLAALYSPIDSTAVALAVACVICLPALSLIWFPEALAEAPCFARGVAHSSPPALIAAMGWAFLVGYPALLAYVSH